MERIQWKRNTMAPSSDKFLSVMDVREVKKAKAFHESFPQYSITPLVSLKNLASHIGVDALFVKDESYRFGLNAFKVLGGSYAMAKYVAQQTGKAVEDVPYDVLTSAKLKEEFGQATFFTATDGNHGRGVAWAANKLGQKSVVFMPKGSTEYRRKQIENEGATVTIEDFNYDECVRLATKKSKEVPNGVVVQDTAWEGYEEIPNWIMQGYGTMAMETANQLEADNCKVPTHVFVQAGVGSLAGSVVGYFTNLYSNVAKKPKLVVVEAAAAACLYKGAVADDGKPRIVEGDLETIHKNGVACGATHPAALGSCDRAAGACPTSALNTGGECGSSCTFFQLGSDRPKNLVRLFRGDNRSSFSTRADRGLRIVLYFTNALLTQKPVERTTARSRKLFKRLHLTYEFCNDARRVCRLS